MQKEQLLQLVIEIIQLRLHTDHISITATSSLQDLPGFDSLVVAEVLERLEERLCIEIQPEYIVMETFSTPYTIVDALIQSNGTFIAEEVNGNK